MTRYTNSNYHSYSIYVISKSWKTISLHFKARAFWLLSTLWEVALELYGVRSILMCKAHSQMLFIYWLTLYLSPFTGGSKAIRAWWSDVWWMPGYSLWRKICPVLLCQCYLLAVLLWILLGEHSFSGWTRVPQATREGRRRPAPSCALPLELRPGPKASSTGANWIEGERSAASGLLCSGNLCIHPWL